SDESSNKEPVKWSSAAVRGGWSVVGMQWRSAAESSHERVRGGVSAEDIIQVAQCEPEVGRATRKPICYDQRDSLIGRDRIAPPDEVGRSTSHHRAVCCLIRAFYEVIGSANQQPLQTTSVTHERRRQAGANPRQRIVGERADLQPTRK